MKEDLMVLFGLRDQSVDEIQIIQVVDDILERAMQIAQHKKAKVMDVQSLSLALLQTASCVATEILHRYDICLLYTSIRSSYGILSFAAVPMPMIIAR